MTEITRVLHDHAAIVLLQSRVEHFADQTGLAASAHSRYHGHDMQRETDGQVLQVVLASTFYFDIIVPVSSFFRYVECEQFRSRLTFIHNLASVASCLGTHFYNMVGCGDNILVMLHDNNSVPQIPQFLQDVNQAFGVTWVQTDGRFIQYVQ